MRAESFVDVYNRFFIGIVFFSILCIILLYSDYKIYHLLNYGNQTTGLVKSVEITKGYSIEIGYLYRVGDREYVGEQFYNDKIKYDSVTANKMREKILSKSSFVVYYDPGNPEKAFCFITEEAFEFHYFFLLGVLFGWIIWLLQYYKVKCSES